MRGERMPPAHVQRAHGQRPHGQHPLGGFHHPREPRMPPQEVVPAWVASQFGSHLPPAPNNGLPPAQNSGLPPVPTNRLPPAPIDRVPSAPVSQEMGMGGPAGPVGGRPLINLEAIGGRAARGFNNFMRFVC